MKQQAWIFQTQCLAKKQPQQFIQYNLSYIQFRKKLIYGVRSKDSGCF